jgi:DNA-binding transcriptional regulator YhcF (GntR family)
MPKKSNLKSKRSPARMEPQGDQLLSTPAFAAAIGVTRQHVSRLERAGIIEKHSRGRYSVSEIGKVIAFREGSIDSDDPDARSLTAERIKLVRG